jgi:predicted helicase
MKKDKLAQVFHVDVFGKREMKYDFLNNNALATIQWNALSPQAPELFFIPKNFETKAAFDKGFAVSELFILNNVGIVTARDEFTIHNTKQDAEKTITEFLSLDDEVARSKFNLGKDVRDWQVNYAKKDLQTHYPNKGIFTKIGYRPFDIKWTFYTGKSKGFHCYPRNEVMQHFIKGDNVGLILEKIMMNKNLAYKDVFITKNIYDAHSIGSASYSFPLYLYPETNAQQTIDQNNERKPNLNIEIVNQIAKDLGLQFASEKTNNLPLTTNNYFAPIDILDYIYAVLHSPTYREKYKEFLKIDFPRVPYPKDANTFWQLVALGSEIRQIHLLESPIVSTYITQYPIDGENVVTKPKYENGKVFINDTQYFDNVPQVAWEFYIGGYQPAQKWLKDRKGRTLEFDDILHYQKIIVALTETHRLMKEIDKVII